VKAFTPAGGAGGSLAPHDGRQVLHRRLLDEGGHQPLAQKGPRRGHLSPCVGIRISRAPVGQAVPQPAPEPGGRRRLGGEDPLLQPGEQSYDTERVPTGGEELVSYPEVTGSEEVPPERGDLLFLGISGSLRGLGLDRPE
jgi:hypothetical protein